MIEVFNRLCETHSFKCKLEDLINWLEERQINYRNYVRLQSIINIIRMDKEEKGRILTMLFSYYSKNYLRNHFLTSLRLNESNKNSTITKIREVE